MNRVMSLTRRLHTGAEALSGPLNFLRNKRVQPTGTRPLEVFSPVTGKLLQSTFDSSEEDCDAAICAAGDAFQEWADMQPLQRGKLMQKAADLVRANAQELAKLETTDNGKPIWESLFDIEGCADTLTYYGGLAADLTGQNINVGPNTLAYTRREPIGVTAGIGAWNYPFQMAVFKSAPALACGNTMVFKPSELSPMTAVCLAELYVEAGIPEGVFSVVQGGGAVGSYLVNHPSVKKVSFTGSVATGALIYSSIAKDIKHCTLELGGKSPCIIFDDANIENAVKGAMLANFLTQGEVCSNGTRVFVHDSIYDEFLERLTEKTKAMKIGDPFQEGTLVGATISPAHAAKVLGYIELAQSEGATVHYGGTRASVPAEFAGGEYLLPCILTNCNDEMTCVREEIFGSVLSLLRFTDEEEVIRRANDSELGLAAGFFTQSLSRAHRVAAKLQAGIVYVNNYNMLPTEVPFGGVKKSGIGRECGREALNYWSQTKTVLCDLNEKIDSPYD